MYNNLEKLRESNRITHEALQACKKYILARPYCTKSEVQTLAEFYLTRYTVKSAFKGINGFTGVICISLNDEIIHGLPSDDKIEKGDVVSLDFGVIYEGYYSDAAITFVNEAEGLTTNKDIVNLVKDTEVALLEAIESLKSSFPICHISQITSTVEAVARLGNYGIVKKFGGHGIGTVLHNPFIFIPNYLDQLKSDQALKAGDVFTIEPMFTLGVGETVVDKDGFTIKTADKSLSAHFELSIAITLMGIEVLK